MTTSKLNVNEVIDQARFTLFTGVFYFGVY